MADQDAWGMMTVGSFKDWLRAKLRAWLGIREIAYNIEAITISYVEADNVLKQLIDVQVQAGIEHQRRIEDLEKAYAQDPRRAEIAKEKAEKLNVVPGFQPRSARRSRWETERKAEPKK